MSKEKTRRQYVIVHRPKDDSIYSTAVMVVWDTSKIEALRTYTAKVGEDAKDPRYFNPKAELLVHGKRYYV